MVLGGDIFIDLEVGFRRIERQPVAKDRAPHTVLIEVRFWQVFQKKLSLLGEHRREDLVIGNWLVVVGRIQELRARQQLAEIAVAHGHAGNDVAEHQRLPDHGSLVIGKKESLVPLDWSADGAAKLVALQDVLLQARPGRSAKEEVAGVELIVPHKLEEVSVELVGPALNSCSNHIRGVPEFRRHVAGFHLKFLNRVNIRLDQRTAQLDFGYVGAIERPTCLLGIGPVNTDVNCSGPNGAGTRVGIRAPGGVSSAGSELCQLPKGATVERDVGQNTPIDDLTDIRSGCSKQWRRGADRNLLRRRAHL